MREVQLSGFMRGEGGTAIRAHAGYSGHTRERTDSNRQIGKRQTNRHTDKQTQTDRNRHRHRDSDRETERQRQTDRDRNKDREADRDRLNRRQTGRQNERKNEERMVY